MTSNLISFTKNIFDSLAQYGTEMIPAANLALLRGTGLYNPGPIYDQTINRGPAYSDAYLIAKAQDLEEPGLYEDPAEYNGSMNYGTSYTTYDNQNKHDYIVGSSYFTAEAPDSWTISDYKGSRGTDRYQIFAINALKSVPTPLLNFFFSEDNVNHIQDTLVSEVKRIRKVDIKHQDTNQLLTIMVNMYEYAIQGALPLSIDTSNTPIDIGVPKGQEIPGTGGLRSAYWNLPDSSGSGMSLEFQIAQLNQAVVQECIKQILSGIDAYKQYYKDASSIPMPMDRPVLSTNKGANVLQENLGFYSSHDINKDIASYNQRYNVI